MILVSPNHSRLHSPLLSRTAEKNWGMRLVGVGDSLGELKGITKTRVTEAHRGRMADVRKSKIHNPLPPPPHR